MRKIFIIFCSLLIVIMSVVPALADSEIDISYSYYDVLISPTVLLGARNGEDMAALFTVPVSLQSSSSWQRIYTFTGSSYNWIVSSKLDPNPLARFDRVNVRYSINNSYPAVDGKMFLNQALIFDHDFWRLISFASGDVRGYSISGKISFLTPKGSLISIPISYEPQPVDSWNWLDSSIYDRLTSLGVSDGSYVWVDAVMEFTGDIGSLTLILPISEGSSSASFDAWNRSFLSAVYAATTDSSQYNAGYQNGYLAGQSVTTSEKYNEGYSAGYASGVEDGNTSFYDQGYDVGFSEGLSMSGATVIPNLSTWLLDVAAGVLDTPLFGTFTLGNILVFFIVLSVVFIVLKFIKF